MDFIQDFGIQIMLAVLTLTLIDDFVVDVVSKIPMVGKMLAPIVRRVIPGFKKWLSERVGKQAEAIVAQTEAQFAAAPQTGAIKKDVATKALVEAMPGLEQIEAEREIQAAFNRLVGQQALAQQAASRAPAPKPAAAAGGPGVTP